MAKLSRKDAPEATFSARAIVMLPIALPIIALQSVTVFLIYVVATFEKRILPWLGRGLGQHFYWPFVIIQRVLQGKPTWWPSDLRVGRQPRTDEERARAEAHPKVLKSSCMCGNPDCDNKKNPYYVWNPTGAPTPPAVDNFLSEAQNAVYENAAKAAAYDKMVELKDGTIAEMNRTIEANERVIALKDDTIALKDEAIRLLDEKASLLSERVRLLEDRAQQVRATHVVH